MKRYILLLALLLASLLYPQSKIDINDLVKVDGKMYKPLSDKLYSGIVYDSYTGTGEKKLEGFYRNGLMNGEWTWWNVFGGIDSTGNFRKGLFYGQWKFYHSNGQLKAKGNYRNGEGTNRDEYGLTAHGRHGKWTFWHDNGIQASEITYKEGEIVGIWTSWNEQGQKEWEGTLEEYKIAEAEARLKAEEEARLAAKKEAEDKKAAAEKRRKAYAAKKAEEAKLAAEAAKKTEEEAKKAEMAEAIAQQAVDCQTKYDESQAAYEDGNLEANIALKREILGMGCDEELSSKAQYYIGWTYGNKLFDMDAAQAEYQKGANNYFSGLKYVEKCEEKLALYKKNDEAEAVYKAGEFAKAAALREEVGLTKGCDKELAAKNLYQAGYIHQKKLNGNAKAKALYEAVVISFSGSGYVDRAKQKLATL